MATKNRRIPETATGQPAVESPKQVPDRQTGQPSFVLGQKVSDNGLLCQPEVGFQAGLDVASIWERVRLFYINWLSLDLPRDGEFIEP